MNKSDQKSSAHNMAIEQVLKRMNVEPSHGLSDREVRRRSDQYGPNKLHEAKRRTARQIVVAQFTSTVIIVLVVAGAVAFTLQHWAEGIAIVAVLFVNSALGFDQRDAVTVSFLTLAFAKLWFVFNLRRPGSSLFNNAVLKNPYVGGAIVLCIFLLLAAVYLPPVSGVLKTVSPTGQGWLVVLGMSLVPFVFGQLLRDIQKAKLARQKSEAFDKV